MEDILTAACAARTRKCGIHTHFWWKTLLENDKFEEQIGNEGVILRRT
jgi:hypothetical protein